MSSYEDEERKPRRAPTLPVRFEELSDSGLAEERRRRVSPTGHGFGREREPGYGLDRDVSPKVEYATDGDEDEAEKENWRRAPPLPQHPRTSVSRPELRRKRSLSNSPNRRVSPIRRRSTYRSDYSDVEPETRSRRSPVRPPTYDDYDEAPVKSRRRVRYADFDDYDGYSRRRTRSPHAPPPPPAHPETRSEYSYPESRHNYAFTRPRASNFRDRDEFADPFVLINNRVYPLDDEEQPYLPIYSQSRSRRHRPSAPAPTPVETNNRAYNNEEEAEDDRYLPAYSRSRARQYAPPPPIPTPVVIDNRIYNDAESEIDLYSRKKIPGRTYGGCSPAPVIINNAIANDSEDEDLDDEDQYLTTKAFAFSLSGHSNDPISPESSINSIIEAGISDTAHNSKDTNPGVSIGQYQEVLHSKYIGDGTIGGYQTAELTLANEDNSAQRNHSLFRWIHYEDSSMDFDRFENNVASISRLTNAERRGLSTVLGRARKFDKPSQVLGGAKARFMAPSIIHESVSHPYDSKTSKAGLVTWMCLPYFCLEKYLSLDLSALKLRPSSHPMKTLLQTRFSLVQKERDMRQAVCQLNDTSADYCYHVAHLWCLVLDDSLLITCSRFPHKSLQADAISIVAEPSSSGSYPHICVNKGKSKVWAFRSEDCLTWFGFISHFWEFWPQTLQFTYNEKVLAESDWTRLLVLAKKSTIHIDLIIRPKEFPRDLLNDPLEIVIPVFDEKASVDAHTQAGSKESAPKTSVEEITHTNKCHTDAISDKSPDKLSPSSESSIVDGTLLDRSPSRSRDQRHGNFHVFTWMNTKPLGDEPKDLSRSVPGSKPPKDSSEHLENCTNDTNVTRDLEEIDRFLSKESNARDRLAYNQCESMPRKKVYDLLVEIGTALLEKPEQKRDLRISYNTQLEILELSETLFQFFLPLSFECATAQKYWGALYRFFNSMPLRLPEDEDNDQNSVIRELLFERSHHDYNVKAAHVLRRWLDTVRGHLKPFKEFLDSAHHIDRAKFHLPEQFSKAWLHLVMSVVRVDNKAFDSHIMVCHELLNLGIRKVFEAFPQKSLTESSVLSPFDLISLVNLHLLNDIHHTTNERDICDTYWEYLKALEDEVEANPLDRSHQGRITMLKQEISVIMETLSIQRNMFTTDRQSGAGHLGASEGIAPRNEGYTSQDYRSRTRNREYEFQVSSGRSKLSPTGSNALQGLLVQDSIVLLEKRLVDFKQVENRARDLETWNLQKIDSNKDRQDSAIFAFTIVTVIFLPLSTVASILGMNTSDIRNMEIGQWVFWTVAVPLLIVVVLVCLIWTGELQHVMGVMGSVWRAAGGVGRRMPGGRMGNLRAGGYGDVGYVGRGRRYGIEGGYYRPQRRYLPVEEMRGSPPLPPPPSPYYRI